MFVDIAEKNCENCTQGVNEKTFRDRGSRFVVISIIGASLNVF